FAPTARRRYQPVRKSSVGGSRREEIRRKSFWYFPMRWTSNRSKPSTGISPVACASRSAGAPILLTTSSDEVVSKIGAPAERDAHATGEMPVDGFDRFDVHRIGKYQKLFLRISSLLLPPTDDFLTG